MARQNRGLMLTKLTKLKNWQVAAIIVVIGFAVYFSGLNNPFQGDDTYQIVNNIPVHSLKNIFLFFHSSTFYNGQKLTGIYYRPMMSLVFAIIYALFELRPLYYHILQLAIFMGSAFVSYLIFKKFFKAWAALAMALILLVHPLNSQVVFAIPSMQDALFFLFGVLALWVLIGSKKSTSLKPYWVAAGLLFLSLLSKETAVAFLVICLVYVYLYDHDRIVQFARIVALPAVLYLLLKINAVGLNAPQHGAPIDKLSLSGRLMTDPSIILFYITKFIYPWKLATGYYWDYPNFSVGHVLFPLFLDLAVIGLFIYLAVRVRAKLSVGKYRAYVFFGCWTIIGLLPYLQVIPLDMTACETWFYLSMAGLLGMIALGIMTFNLKLKPLLVAAVLLIVVTGLGVRTNLRGNDYKNQYVLAKADLKVSSDDYSAMNNIAEGLISQHKYEQAVNYAKHSAAIYPTVSNYDNLGVALEYSYDYPAAVSAYDQALKYGTLNIIYENLAEITLLYGKPNYDEQLFEKAIKTYPQDSKIWLYLAMMEDAAGSNPNARVAINYAAKYGNIPTELYSDIYYGRPFKVDLPIAKTPIEIP